MRLEAMPVVLLTLPQREASALSRREQPAKVQKRARTNTNTEACVEEDEDVDALR
jgi:hypothetical protein